MLNKTDHSELITAIKYGDLKNGTVVIKLGDQLIMGSINNFSTEMSTSQMATEFTISGFIMK